MNFQQLNFNKLHDVQGEYQGLLLGAVMALPEDGPARRTRARTARQDSAAGPSKSAAGVLQSGLAHAWAWLTVKADCCNHHLHELLTFIRPLRHTAACSRLRATERWLAPV